MASIRHHLDGWGLTHYFKVIVSGEQFSASKPDPEIFLRAAEALGTQPGRTLVLEDSYNGVRAGAAGGFAAALVHSVEALEHSLLVFFGNSDSGICHTDIWVAL